MSRLLTRKPVEVCEVRSWNPCAGKQTLCTSADPVDISQAPMTTVYLVPTEVCSRRSGRLRCHIFELCENKVSNRHTSAAASCVPICPSSELEKYAPKSGKGQLSPGPMPLLGDLPNPPERHWLRRVWEHLELRSWISQVPQTRSPSSPTECDQCV